MGLETSIEKLDKYYDRLEKGKVQKIKPDHVRKVTKKLKAKEKILLTDIEEATKESKVERLQRKLKLVREQLERAQWLEDKISSE